MDQIDHLTRIIQESVPGKQVTIAHAIAAPGPDISERVGIETRDALGILTITPSEAAIIAADIAYKAANVSIGFLDRFTGAVLITGDIQSVEQALQAVTDVLAHTLGFTVVPVTKS